MTCFSVLDYGARGDGSTNDAAAIQAAIDACAANGGGTVLLPAGRTYLAGYIELKSNMEFRIERGARLRVSTRQDDLVSMMTMAGYSRDIDKPDRVFIGANRASNIAVTGGGIIDGRAKEFMREEREFIYKAIPERPHLLFFVGSRNITIKDITIEDAPVWAIRLSGCEDVVIHGIRILNDLKVPNCDGIDPDHCRNVRISDCHIEAGDDCIVIKTRREFPDFGPSENITVTGCTLVSTSCALKIGTETTDDIRNVVFDSCVVKSSNRGLGIMLRDEGNLENIVFSNMVVETRFFYESWWGKAEPIYVTAFHREPGSRLGTVRGVRFSNILCRSENGVFISGCADSLLDDIQLTNVQVELNKHSRWPGGVYDRRPCDIEGLVAHRTAGIYCAAAQNITLRHCRVSWGENRPDYYGHALESHGVADLVFEDVVGAAAHPQRDRAQLIDQDSILDPDRGNGTIRT